MVYVLSPEEVSGLIDSFKSKVTVNFYLIAPVEKIDLGSVTLFKGESYVEGVMQCICRESILKSPLRNFYGSCLENFSIDSTTESLLEDVKAASMHLQKEDDLALIRLFVPENFRIPVAQHLANFAGFSPS